MSRVDQLSRGAVEFLLRTLETPHMRVTAAALSLQPPSLKDELLGCGYLVPDGYEAAASSPDLQDRVVSLLWSEDSGTFGYFDPAEGWVSVDHEAVTRFRV